MPEQDKSVLDEKVNPNYYEAVKEIAELLTSVPEEKREKIVERFVYSILHC